MTTIYCPTTLRGLWPSPLAQQWYDQFPGLFDEDDLRLAQSQPGYHFHEWFVATYLFHRDSSHSLMEHYAYPSHAHKQDVYRAALTDVQRHELESIERELHVQLPDLLVFAPGYSSFSFAEVKGPGDQLSAKQLDSHAAIRDRLRVSVEIVNVVLTNIETGRFRVSARPPVRPQSPRGNRPPPPLR